MTEDTRAAFEEAGKAAVERMITSLEEARPGWDPTFYHTLSYEGDIAEADRLRDQYDTPRPARIQQRIDSDLRDLKQYRAEAQKEKRPEGRLVKIKRAARALLNIFRGARGPS